jgi:hypothetical protein
VSLVTGRPGRSHHQGDYSRRARLVRQAANANPLTKCWRCGRTLSQHPPHHTGKPPTWQAGHVIDHDPASPLAPEASTCNTSAGATYGNARREPRSEDW